MKDKENNERMCGGNQPFLLPCVWMHSGNVDYKLCDKQYDCETCPFDFAMRHADSAAGEGALIKKMRDEIRLIRSLLRAENAEYEKEVVEMVAVLVILTIAVFVLADAILQWKEEDMLKRVPAGREEKPAAPDFSFAFEGMTIPGGVFHDRGHTWVEIQPAGTAHVGVDVFSQRLLGKMQTVELPEAGKEIRRGEPLFTLHKDGRAATFLSPLDGKIETINKTVRAHPDALRDNPYGKNWLCRIQPAAFSRALKKMAVAEEARSWMKSEIKRFQTFLSSQPAHNVTLGALLQDGGQPVQGLLEMVDRQTWQAFEKKFLHVLEG